MELFDLPHIYLFLGLLPLVAFMYAGVGHGGASGYLALMALFMFPPDIMKPTALLLNIFIAGVSFWAFKKRGHFNWKLFYPFAVASIPERPPTPTPFPNRSACLLELSETSAT